MIIVRFILVDITLPVRMRPRIEMSPVKGHFLSGWVISMNAGASHDRRTDVGAVDSLTRRLEP